MNLPNLLTLSRIGLVYVFIAIAAFTSPSIGPSSAYGYDESFLRLLAFFVTALAALTDFFDGYIARRRNEVTNFGKLMDPLADKIFLVATITVGVRCQLVPAWIAVVILSREFLITGLRLLAVQQGEIIAANIWGKAKTLFQMIMLFIAGLAWSAVINLNHGRVCGMAAWDLWYGFLVLVVALTIWSGLSYCIKYRHLFLKTLR